MTEKERKEHLRAYHKAYRAKHREKCLEYQRRYKNNHRQQVRAATKKYDDAHKAQSRARREAHKEEMRAYNKNYRTAHLETMRKADKARYAKNRDRIRQNGPAYRAKNIEAITARKKAYYAACRDEILAKKKAFYDAHPEKQREIAAKFYAAHRNRICAYLKVWRRANKGIVNAHVMKRNATKLRATPTWVDQDSITVVYQQAARMTEDTGVRYDVDHVIPLQGRTVCGLHVHWNLQVLTRTDNIRKGNRMVHATTNQPQPSDAAAQIETSALTP